MTRVLFVLIGLSVATAPAHADISKAEHRAAVRQLRKAASDRDVDEFISAQRRVLRLDVPRSVKTVVGAYAECVDNVDDSLSDTAHYRFHMDVADLFRSIKGKKALSTISKAQMEHESWCVRLLLLEARQSNVHADGGEAALTALRDDHPAVVRRALRFLSERKTRRVVDAIIACYLRVAKRAGKGKASADKESAEWERTGLICASALARLLKVEFTAAEDYRNYVNARSGEDALFEPQGDKRDRKKRSTLFGANVTGKNIVFVLDVSGSMMTVDPIKLTRRKSRKTTVGKRKKSSPKSLKRHRRIERAKKELANVIRYLPPDVRFNVVAFSSIVEPWSDDLRSASKKNRSRAIKYVRSLEPEGITVTDRALEEALADPSVDSIYLLTDGAPTHVGSVGPELPRDAPRLMTQIVERMEEVSFLRGVRIQTFGFRVAEESFLQQLAQRHWGKYTRIE